MEILFILIPITVIILLICLYNNENTSKEKSFTEQSKRNTKQAIPKYQPKKLMTKTEINYANAIRKALPEGYRVFPQICLASILQKNIENKFANELFRIVDFCVFDTEYNPILIIEINDATHHEKNRIARDYKVKDLCEIAHIPLLKLWTEYGINQEYINKKIKELIA